MPGMPSAFSSAAQHHFSSEGKRLQNPLQLGVLPSPVLSATSSASDPSDDEDKVTLPTLLLFSFVTGL